VLAPVGVLAVLLTPLVGRNMHRIDPRWFVTASFGIFALVMVMRSHFDTDASIGTLLVPTLIQGAALATFFVPLISLGLSGLAPERIPAASGLMNFARITAGSFGTSIVTTLWDRRATLHHAQLVEHLGDASAQQSYGVLNRLVDQQAFMLSATEIFYVSALLFLALVALIWLARPVRDGAAVNAGGAH
jgi:MFS transporter, DHA2 family, multidrug resistance protein